MSNVTFYLKSNFEKALRQAEQAYDDKVRGKISRQDLQSVNGSVNGRMNAITTINRILLMKSSRKRK